MGKKSRQKAVKNQQTDKQHQVFLKESLEAIKVLRHLMRTHGFTMAELEDMDIQLAFNYVQMLFRNVKAELNQGKQQPSEDEPNAEKEDDEPNAEKEDDEPSAGRGKGKTAKTEARAAA